MIYWKIIFIRPGLGFIYNTFQCWFLSSADYLPWAWIWMSILLWFRPLPVPTTFNTRPWCPSTRETPCTGTTRECPSPAVWLEGTPAQTTTPPWHPATWGHCLCHSSRTQSKPRPVRCAGTNPQGSTTEWTHAKDARYACTSREDPHFYICRKIIKSRRWRFLNTQPIVFDVKFIRKEHSSGF